MFFFLSHLSTLLLFLWLYKLSGPAVLNFTHPQFYPVNLSIRVGINVDPDQIFCQKPSDLVLQCLQRTTNLVLPGSGQLKEVIAVYITICFKQ